MTYPPQNPEQPAPEPSPDAAGFGSPPVSPPAGDPAPPYGPPAAPPQGQFAAPGPPQGEFAAPATGPPQAPFMSGPPSAPFGGPPPKPGGARPGTVTGAAVLLGGYALVALITLLVRSYFLFSHMGSHDWLDWYLPLHSIMFQLLAIMLALLAAGLTIAGRDAGRALAFVFCGYELIAGCSSLMTSAVFAVRAGDVEFLRILDMFAMIVMLGLTLVAFVLLMTRRASDWFRAQGAPVS